ncbi:cell envelope integrity EipB family protein [Beijerinckia indica]|uniref:ATP/GTP-binding site motif A n=1 Tax=Beijerinckia indica subsp. indica (strain ATCC 9039 / DSM 1715 / NCIMB 8712) TaxID=395963 RepID=B2IDI3_BEII9|nr:cell envelope integrity EipB family protein [Beijerinckia indica]ACB95419.1 protein of unknown function DUF1849 [Beijerinckia indica subsp. indica ATCC 9039]
MSKPSVRPRFLPRAFVVRAFVVAAACGLGSTALWAAPNQATTPAAPQKVGVDQNIPLAAHRAIYDLTLLRSTGAKSPVSAQGRIAFDFTGSACEGYVQNFRQLTELQPAEGPTRVSDMRSATFEDGDGRNFTFKIQTTNDQGPGDLVDGKARRATSGPVLVDLTKPKKTKFDLAADAVFPTEHLRLILQAAKAGEHLLQVNVYDGSEKGDKLFETTTIIGNVIEKPATETAVKIPALEGLRRWPVSISYFENARKDENPAYKLAFDLYENGISRALRLDYGDFVLSGELSSLELLPQQACAK